MMGAVKIEEILSKLERQQKKKFNCVTLNERVNLEAVKYLITKPKAWWREILKTDKQRKFEIEYNKVKVFLYGQLDGTGHQRTYKFANGKDFGRQFDHSGLQGMQKDVRGVLCNGIISDLDIVNCHPIILAWVCKEHQIPCGNLEYYIKHRNKILNDLAQNGFDKDEAKRLFLKSTNSSFRRQSVGYDFYDAYDAEMKKIQIKLMEIPEYAFIKPKVKKGDNEEGSFINLCLCYHENKILMKAYDFLTSKKVEICTLSFDGLMHYGAEDTKLLNELNTYISNKYIDAGFKFVYKPHSKNICLPKEFNGDSVPDKNYIQMCESFNKVHAKVGDKYICEDIKGKMVVQTEMNMKARYKHLNVYDRDEQFIDAWLKNKTGTNMRIYQEFGLYPDKMSCPNDVFNLWEPFAYSLKTGDYEPDTQGLSKILHLVRVLADNDENLEKFLLDWMAQMVQYPHIKSLMPVIRSDQGAGKNTLIEILKEILGPSKVWDCTDPLRDIFGCFNDKMRDAFLINMNETASKDFTSVMGKVKNAVTDPTFSYRAMQQGTTELPSFHRYIITTNADFPIPTSRGDRRTCIIDASNELVGNTDFFEDMQENVIGSETAMRTFWDFLMNRPVKKKMTKADLPVTEYQEELQRLDEHPIILWLQHIATDYRSSKIIMKPENMWQDFKNFCDDDNLKKDRFTKRGFETKLGFILKSLPQASTKYGSTDGRVRKFDLDWLRGHYKITLLEEKFEDDPE